MIAIAAEEYLRARKTNRRLEISAFAAGFGELEASVLRAAEVMDYFLSSADAPGAACDVWPAPGDRFLQFELVEQLGGGVLSRVYIARDHAVAQRHVIVKLTPSSDREIETLGRLAHPGIGPILSIESDHVTGLTAVVMPYQSRVTLHNVIDWLSRIDGFSRRDVQVAQMDREIRERNSQEPSPPGFGSVLQPPERRLWHSEWVAEFGIAVADALHAAHQHGILHCDVKPSNIVLIDSSRPMLVDFNLALGDASRIASGGTVPYMPPEQLCGAPLDERADVFSLAATLYHALTGTPPFGGPEMTLSQALSARIAGPSRTAVQLHSLLHVDPALAPVILGALAFEPAERPASAAEFAQSLRRCLSPSSRLKRILRRRRRDVCAAAAAATLLLAGLGAWQLQRDPVEVIATRAAIDEASRFDFEECIRLATKALEENPDLLAARLIRVEAAIRRGHLNPAYVDLKQIASQFASEDVRMLLSYMDYLFLKDDDQAIVDMQMSLQSGLNEVQVRNNLGYCHLVRGHSDKAAFEFKLATEIDPRFEAGWLNLAVANLDMAMQDEQVLRLDYIETAIALGPKSQDIRRVAVDVYVQDVRAGGSTRAVLERHCAEAVRLGVPVNEVVRALGRLPEDVARSIEATLPEDAAPRDDTQVVRTMGFVIPCDIPALALSLLDQNSR